MILVLCFYIILIDPAGAIGLKFPVLILLIINFLIFSKNIKFNLQLVFVALIFINLAGFFLLKQEIFFENNDVSRIVAQSIFLFGLFLILSLQDNFIELLYTAVRLFLVTNLIFLCIGAFFPTFAVAVNIALKDYSMFSLETRDHHVTQYAFYHNSVYAAVVYFPKLCSDIKRLNFKNIEFILCALSILSLAMTQSRSVYLGMFIVLVLYYWRYALALLPVIIVIGLVVFPNLESLIFDASTSTKISYLEAFKEQFGSVISVLVGTGPLMVNWGSNIGSFDIIELTYFEMFRYFGILGAITIFVIFLYLCLRLRRSSEMWLYGSGVVGYLGMSFVNPYVWGLTGLPLLALPLALSYNRKRSC